MKPLPKPLKPYPKSETFKEDYLQTHKQRIKRPRKIHYFGFEYNYRHTFYQPVDSKKFLKPLEDLKVIQEIKLQIYQVNEESTISKDFSHKLKPLSSLKSLNLHFAKTHWLFFEKGVKDLTNALGGLKRLSELTLNFNSWTEGDDNFFNILFRGLKKIKNLKSLHLDLSGCEKITEKSFRSLASLFKRSFKSLEELSLKLENPTISAKALDILASGMTHLTCLKKLEIPMLNFQIAQESDSDTFIFSIHHMECLRELYLNLSSLQNDMTTLEILATSLDSLKELCSLYLKLMKSEKAFSLQEMELLTQSFESFPYLEYLTLDFRQYPGIEDEAFANLSTVLEGFKEIKEINLSFDKCLQVGDFNVEKLIDRLEKFPNLEFVNFGFTDCPKSFNHEHYKRLQLVKNLEGVYFACEKSKE